MACPGSFLSPIWQASSWTVLVSAAPCFCQLWPEWQIWGQTDSGLSLSQVGLSFCQPPRGYARDLMAYGDVYWAVLRAKHCFRQPWLNITLTALMCLAGLALSITAENGNVWSMRVCHCSPKEALYGMFSSVRGPEGLRQRVLTAQWKIYIFISHCDLGLVL